jgi:hypothetical protein
MGVRVLSGRANALSTSSTGKWTPIHPMALLTGWHLTSGSESSSVGSRADERGADRDDLLNGNLLQFVIRL